MKKIILFLIFWGITQGAFSLEKADSYVIHTIIEDYTDAWNLYDCHGFADNFAENADFVNIYGMHFSGKAQIEERHVKIMQGFLKGSKLTILDYKLREARPGVVVALINWKLDGFRDRNSDQTQTREGIFTQIFVKNDRWWEITSSQNTLKP